jgi:hypothetical protein
VKDLLATLGEERQQERRRGPPKTSSATLRSSLSPAICEQAASRPCSVASTLRESTHLAGVVEHAEPVEGLADRIATMPPQTLTALSLGSEHCWVWSR